MLTRRGEPVRGCVGDKQIVLFGRQSSLARSPERKIRAQAGTGEYVQVITERGLRERKRKEAGSK